MRSLFLVLGFASLTALATRAQESASWDKKGAAAYLESRQAWRTTVPSAARDAVAVLALTASR